MVSLSDIVLDERTTFIDVGNTAVRVTYAPQRFTTDFETIRMGPMQYSDILRTLVISWDLETDDGKPLKLTKAAMGKWPSKIWETLAIGIVTEIREGKAFCANGDDS